MLRLIVTFMANLHSHSTDETCGSTSGSVEIDLPKNSTIEEAVCAKIDNEKQSLVDVEITSIKQI